MMTSMEDGFMRKTFIMTYPLGGGGRDSIADKEGMKDPVP